MLAHCAQSSYGSNQSFCALYVQGSGAVERTKRLHSLFPHLAEDEPPLFTRQIHSSELAVFRWKFKLDLDFSYFRAGPYVTDSVSMQCVQLELLFCITRFRITSARRAGGSVTPGRWRVHNLRGAHCTAPRKRVGRVKENGSAVQLAVVTACWARAD